MTLRAGRSRSGFSVLELVVTVAVVGVLASLLVNMTGGTPTMVANAKLESDVVMLNQLVGLYLADGGKLDGISSPQMVLDSMKRSRPSDGMQQYTGVSSGKLVDVRMTARMSPASQTGVPRKRAVWSTIDKQFEVESNGGPGIDEFYLDPALSSADYGTSSRRSQAVSYNKSNGWIWGGVAKVTPATEKQPAYVEAAGTQTYFNPNESSGSTSGSGGGGSGGSSGSGGTTGGGVPSTGGSSTPQLPQPIITPAGGTFTRATFPAGVSISANGAPGGQSRLVYQQNNGPWENYTGVITVQSGDTIEAQNVTRNAAEVTSSTVASASYYMLVPAVAGGGTATWADITGGGNLVQTVTQDGQTITLAHGDTSLDLGGGQSLDAGVQNVISFTQNSFSDIAPNTWFALGNVSVLNGTTFYESEASGATLKVNFDLTSPAASGSFDIRLAFISNENSADRDASADAVEIETPQTGTLFSSGGVSYRLELSWVSLDSTSGGVQGDQLLVYEGSTARAELRARFLPDR